MQQPRGDSPGAGRIKKRALLVLALVLVLVLTKFALQEVLSVGVGVGMVRYAMRLCAHAIVNRGGRRGRPS